MPVYIMIIQYIKWLKISLGETNSISDCMIYERKYFSISNTNTAEINLNVLY